jgi:hypothetical protein
MSFGCEAAKVNESLKSRQAALVDEARFGW